MKKRISLIIFLLIIMLATNVFAATKSVDTTMSIVEDNVCTIQLEEMASFEKKMISYDLTKHQVTIQLDIKNDAKEVIPSGVMMLVIDSSSRFGYYILACDNYDKIGWLFENGGKEQL